MKELLEKKPSFFQRVFWPDGMVRVSGREYNGLIESPCYQNGDLSCLCCHSMHDSDPNDQLKLAATGNQVCLDCHTTMKDDIAAHTHHDVNSAGSQCYNCHMPHTTIGLLTAMRSHQISSPGVEQELETGRPNACNLCHLDQTLEWTSEKLHAWYQHPAAKLSEEQKTTAASLIWMLKGDAGNRLLAAWHMGWGPAKTAAAGRWTEPFLGSAMVDPYPAVRFNAWRSLRNNGAADGLVYDYVDLNPQSKQSAGLIVKEYLSQKTELLPGRSSILLHQNNGSLDLSRIRNLQMKRDNKRVLLAE